MKYEKTINGRQVVSSCRVIQRADGVWISNPTAEQIAEAGWVECVPPVPVEQDLPDDEAEEEGEDHE